MRTQRSRPPSRTNSRTCPVRRPVRGRGALSCVVHVAEETASGVVGQDRQWGVARFPDVLALGRVRVVEEPGVRRRLGACGGDRRIEASSPPAPARGLSGGVGSPLIHRAAVHGRVHAVAQHVGVVIGQGAFQVTKHDPHEQVLLILTRAEP